MSVRQLNEASLPDDFANIIREFGADPGRIQLEITESSLMADVENNLRILRRLADMGLRCAVDDFGTGYSSLAQLTRLPVSVLKIDRAFVDGLDKSENSRVIVRAIIGLGRALGLKMVAEGVENSSQQNELCAYGCDMIQGYFFYRPMNEDTLIETFNRQISSSLPNTDSRLYFLIYVSRATREISECELATLRKRAREFNRSAGISGCLVYQEGFFMQMLEGKREALQSLMDRIKDDRRHVDIRVVIEGPMRHRVFTDWGLLLHDQRSLFYDSSNSDVLQSQIRRVTFIDLADDPQACVAYITAYSRNLFN